MDKLIFGLCAITSCLCAFLLLRGYLRTRMRLLLWSGLCFVLLFASNLLAIADRWILPDVNLMNGRLLASLLGVMLLIYGLIWEKE